MPTDEPTMAPEQTDEEMTAAPVQDEAAAQ